MKTQFIVILFILLNSLIVFMPTDIVRGDPNPAGGNIVGDTVYWENSYANLSVYPHTSNEFIRQRQWANMTWLESDNTIDVAFRFDNSLSYGKIWKWNGASWNKVTMQHTTYGGKHYYYYTGFNVVQDTTYRFKWEYDVPANTTGKWWLFAKLSEHTVQQALDNNWYVALDPWWDSSWNYFKTIDIESDYISGSLRNFPLLVNSTDTVMIAKCQSNGEDIRFVGTNNLTEFYYEIEKWTDGGFTVWVNISEVIDDNNDYTFLMYYGNGGAADNQTASGVWDGDYLGVYHLNQSAGVICYDSTANNNNGTYFGNLPTRVTSKIGWGQDLEADDANSWITFPDACWLTGTNFGMHEVFVRHESNTGLYMTQWDNAGTDRTYFSVSAGNYFSQGETGGVSQWAITGGTVPSAQWFHAVSVMEENNARLVVDGFIIDADTSCSMPSVDVSNKNTIRFGSQFDGSAQFFDGIVDEIRISDVVRNVSWINASFHSQNQTPGFMSLGTEVVGGVWVNSPPINSNPDPSDASVINAITPALRIQVNDTDMANQSVNITWLSNSSGSWVQFGLNYSSVNNTFYQTFDNATTLGETYWWRTQTNDGNSSGWDNDTYSFRINSRPAISAEFPSNNTVGDPGGTVSITMTDGDDDTFSYTIEFDSSNTTSGRDVGSSSETGQSNGVKSLSVNLSQNITYTWWVNCTDGYVSTNASYNFTNRVLYADPPTSGISHYYETVQYLYLSWTGNSRGDKYIIVQNNNTYPTGAENVSNNFVRQNSSDLEYNISWTSADSGFFSVFSWNSSANIYSQNHSDRVGLDLVWGALAINVYNESNSSEGIEFDIEVSNSDSTEVYFAYDQTNTLNIDFNDIPFGDNTIFFITSEGYESRTSYYDLALNNFYGLNFWLPPTEIDSDTTTYLYRLRVIDGYTYPVANATVQIRRYINATGQYENMSILLTDGYGEADISLVPGEHYRAFISKSDFESGIFDWIPDPVFYGANYPKIFQIIRPTEIETIYTFWDLIRFNATLHTNDSLFVNYVDHNTNTTDAQFYIYEHYNFSTTYITTESTTSNTHSFWVNGLNHSREHEITIYLNHTTLGFEIKSITVLPVSDAIYDGGGEIETKISNAIGPYSLGYVQTFLIYLPIMFFLVLPGPKHPGFGIIMASIYAGFASSFIVVGSILMIVPFAVAIGMILMAVKGGMLKL